MITNDLNHFKSVVAHQFFVAPADRNYFVAKFCRVSNIYEEYWWQILQMVEKYLKAGIILNGGSVKKASGHDLVDLFTQHSSLLGDDALNVLSKPDGLRETWWSDIPVQELIQRINLIGGPGIRYGLSSYWNHRADAYLADQLAFELRRRTIGLTWLVGEHWEEPDLKQFYGRPYQTVLRELPRHQIRPMKLPDKDLSSIGTSTVDLLYAWNFAFARSDEDLSKPAPPSFAPLVAGMANSYLGIFYEAFKEADPEAIRERVCWLIDTIKLGAAEAAFCKLIERQ